MSELRFASLVVKLWRARKRGDAKEVKTICKTLAKMPPPEPQR
jgi:hypothetical protein